MRQLNNNRHRRSNLAVLGLLVLLVSACQADRTDDAENSSNDSANKAQASTSPAAADSESVNPSGPPPGNEQREQTSAPDTQRDDQAAERVDERMRMVEAHMRERGIKDERVLAAMEAVPRHRFVPEEYERDAYGDYPLPIGHEQTISQPYIVALMTELVRPQTGDKALDVGTGSGYQAAILAQLVDQVYSIEIVEPLANEARDRLKSLGYENIEVRFGDGYDGWPDQAPFDVIVLAAAPKQVPQPLIDQLARGGRLVLPVGDRNRQELILIEKDESGEVTRRTITGVAFVPMTGKIEEADR